MLWDKGSGLVKWLALSFVYLKPFGMHFNLSIHIYICPCFLACKYLQLGFHYLIKLFYSTLSTCVCVCRSSFFALLSFNDDEVVIVIKVWFVLTR